MIGLALPAFRIFLAVCSGTLASCANAITTTSRRPD
jgi:hypothetical protein